MLSFMPSGSGQYESTLSFMLTFKFMFNMSTGTKKI